MTDQKQDDNQPEVEVPGTGQFLVQAERDAQGQDVQPEPEQRDGEPAAQGAQPDESSSPAASGKVGSPVKRDSK